MKLRTRLVFVLAVFAAVILTVTITAVTAFSRLGQAVATTTAENLRSIEAAHAMREAIDRQDRGYFLILAGQGGRGRDEVAAGATSFAEQFEVVRGNVTVEGESELVEAIEKAYDRYRKMAEPFRMPPPPPLAATFPFTRGGPPGRTQGQKPDVTTGAAAASPPDPPRIVSGKALDDAPLVLHHRGEGVNGHATTFPSPATPFPLPPVGTPPAPPGPTDAVAPGEPTNAAAVAPGAPPATVAGTLGTPPAVTIDPAAGPAAAVEPDSVVDPTPSASLAAAGLPFDALTYNRLVEDRLADVHKALADLAALNRYAIDSAAQEAARHGWRRSAWVIVVGLLGLALAAVFGRRLYRAIAVPLEAIELGIEALRRGNFARRIGLDTRDELGQIAAAVNAAADQFARLDAAREGQLRLHERLASAVLDAFGPDALVVDRSGEPLVVGRKARERLGPNPMQTLRDGAGGLIPPGEIDLRIRRVFEPGEPPLPSASGAPSSGIDVRPILGRAGSVVGAAVVLPSA